MVGIRSSDAVLRAGVFAIAMTLAGCSLNWPEPDDAAPPIVVEPAEPAAELDAEPPPMPDVYEEPAPEPPAPVPPVAIVLTSGHPVYADVATELGRSLEKFTIVNFAEDADPPVVLLGRINDSSSEAVVAIGLRAAKSAVAMADVPVIFSQVFNYDDAALVTDHSRGVAALPPLEPQLAAWKRLDPALARVGLIIGEGHEAIISEAQAAADRLDVELVIRRSGSDQETLYQFRRMVRDIDGYWLFPDNRILSPRVLGKILAEARQRSVDVSVFNDNLLAMGATISASAVASDIAAKILELVAAVRAGNFDDLPPMTPLSEVRIVSDPRGDDNGTSVAENR